MRNATLIIAFFLFSAAYGEQPLRLTIAVNDLVGKGVEQTIASIISERLRSELLQTSLFKVMERNEMAAVLKEQGFQKSGACDDASCLVEVGQLLGVERMVAGTVGKISTLYTISLRMINVGTGEIMYTINEDFDGEIKSVLTTAVRNAARKLAGGAVDEIAKVALIGKKGDLYIESSPPGATIEIDGEKIDGQTPLTLQGIDVGERRIVGRKHEYYGEKTITLAPEDVLKVNIEMARGKGSCKIFTSPDGAVVSVGGISKGTTPCKIDDLFAGEHQLYVEKDGYLPLSCKIIIGISETKSLSFTLSPAAYVTVATALPSSNILINDIKVGLGSIQKYAVATGKSEVSVENTGFEPWKRTLDLSQNTHEILEVKMVSLFGSLQISTEPSGAGIFLNGQSIGTTPYSNARLQPGKYMLNVVMDTYIPVNDSINVVQNNLLTRAFNLEHTTEYLISARTTKHNLKKQQQRVRRVMFGSLAIVAFGEGLYLNM